MHFLYSVAGFNPEDDGIFVGSLETQAVKRLRDGKAASYAGNMLLFVRDGALMAQRFDPGRLELTGEPWRIRFADQVRSFSVSENGVLAYMSDEHVDAPLMFVDRAGRVQRLEDSVESSQFAVSPDARTLAFSKSGDIWLTDLSRQVTSRFTFKMAGDAFPVWSPDGSRIVFYSNRGGARGIYQKPVNSEMEELIVNTGAGLVESIDDWSPDGKFIIYTARNENGKANLWALPVSGERKPILIPSAFNLRQGRVSPDGRWLAYVSDESGKDEVYVQSFPGRESKWQVSISGGTNPRWRRDGRELFYAGPEKRLMSVNVAAAGPVLQFSTPFALFSMVLHGSYDVTPDGQRFIVSSQRENTRVAPIEIVANWTAERF
jgi:Tol biopolymer transport system component